MVKNSEIKEEQNRILLVGLYGQGKTTTSAKLGLYFKNRSKKVALISTDTWRPAAFDQLKQLGEQIEIDVYGDPSLKSPNEIYTKYSKELEAYDVVIIDSAGRDQLNDELVQEIINLNDLVNPTDTFMVLGADVGQSAQKQAQSFKENLGVTGVVITKMDGTGKGGGALSACSTIEVPVRFIGVGEKVDDLERFNSQKFVSTMLGMGDIDTLLEKAQLAIDDDKARQMGDKMMKGDFDLDDLSEQLGAMKKMGSMGKIMGMIPGMGGMNLPKDEMAKQEVKMKKWKHILSSMTQHERRNPDCLDISRVTRCAKGAGASIGNVRELLKHFKQTKKMMGMFKNPGAMEDMEDMDPKKMMKHMKGMKGMNKFMKK